MEEKKGIGGRLGRYRQESNRKILDKLTKLVEEHPDWRFHQILMNYGIETLGKDKFYEESYDTMVGLLSAVTKQAESRCT